VDGVRKDEVEVPIPLRAQEEMMGQMQVRRQDKVAAPRIQHFAKTLFALYATARLHALVRPRVIC
jgi:hypothetical protein